MSEIDGTSRSIAPIAIRRGCMLCFETLDPGAVGDMSRFARCEHCRSLYHEGCIGRVAHCAVCGGDNFATGAKVVWQELPDPVRQANVDFIPPRICFCLGKLSLCLPGRPTKAVFGSFKTFCDRVLVPTAHLLGVGLRKLAAFASELLGRIGKDRGETTNRGESKEED